MDDPLSTSRNRPLDAIRLLAGIVVMASLGCGAERGHPPTFPVQGTVTFKGKPVTGGYVVYEQDGAGIEGKNPPGEAGTGPLRIVGPLRSDGSFQLNAYPGAEGMPAGRYRVGISSRAGRSETGLFDAGRKVSKGNPDVLGGRYADPKTSGLTDEVKRDRPNEPSFDLNEKGSSSPSRRP